MLTYPPPKYQGPGEVSAVLHRADRRRPDVEIGQSARMYCLDTGSMTGGALGAFLCEFPKPDPGAVPHIHRGVAESFFILDGTMQLHTGRGWVDVTQFDWMSVPPGGIHGFRHEDTDLARMLLFYTPDAPRKPFFEGLAELAAGRPLPDGEALAAFFSRHDTFLLGPPPA